MGYAMAEHFRQTHGGSMAIDQFLKLLNTKVDCYSKGKKSKRHLTLREISGRLKLSPAQVCRLRNGMFEIQWVVQIGTKQCIEDEIHFLNREIKQREDFIKEQDKLKFIPGMLNEPNCA